MRFTVGPKTFVIEFERSFRTIRKHVLDQEINQETGEITEVERVEEVPTRYPYTTCTIREVVEGPKIFWPVFRTFTVGAHHKEKAASHESGRKAALRLALWDEPFVLASDGKTLVRNPRLLSREFKTAAWTAFHAREGGLFQKAAEAKLAREAGEAVIKAHRVNKQARTEAA